MGAIQGTGEIRPLPTSQQAWAESEDAPALELKRHQDADSNVEHCRMARLASDPSFRSRMQPFLTTQGLRAVNLDRHATLGSRPRLHYHWAEPSMAWTQRMVRVRLSSHENRGS